MNEIPKDGKFREVWTEFGIGWIMYDEDIDESNSKQRFRLITPDGRLNGFVNIFRWKDEFGVWHDLDSGKGVKFYH